MYKFASFELNVAHDAQIWIVNRKRRECQYILILVIFNDDKLAIR